MLIFAMVHTILVHGLSVATSLSLAHSYISLNALSKGQSLGLLPGSSSSYPSLSQILGGSTQPVIKVLGRDIPVVRQSQQDEYRAIDTKTLRDRHAKKQLEGSELFDVPTYSPEAALGYVQRAFGTQLGLLVGACVVCMRSWLRGDDDLGSTEEQRREELEKRGYGMYVQARPEVPYGKAVCTRFFSGTGWRGLLIYRDGGRRGNCGYRGSWI